MTDGVIVDRVALLLTYSVCARRRKGAGNSTNEPLATARDCVHARAPSILWQDHSREAGSSRSGANRSGAPRAGRFSRQDRPPQSASTRFPPSRRREALGVPKEVQWVRKCLQHVTLSRRALSVPRLGGPPGENRRTRPARPARRSTQLTGFRFLQGCRVTSPSEETPRGTQTSGEAHLHVPRLVAGGRAPRGERIQSPGCRIAGGKLLGGEGRGRDQAC